MGETPEGSLSLPHDVFSGTSHAVMFRKTLVFAGAGTLLLILVGGCNKSTQEQPAPPIKTNALSILKSEPVTLLQWHWVGAKKIATTTNAASVLALCRLPEFKNA